MPTSPHLNLFLGQRNMRVASHIKTCFAKHPHLALSAPEEAVRQRVRLPAMNAKLLTAN